VITLLREDKFSKQLKFLISFHNPKVVALMAARGFDGGSLEEGWRLLKNAAGWIFELSSQENSTLFADNSEMLTKLDQWENTWFDVTDAALARKFPKIHKSIFNHLSKTHGFEIAKKIKTLLDRIDELENDKDGENAEENKEALLLLEKRGLTSKERESARTLLTQVSDNPISDEIIVDPKLIEEKKRAEEEMWAWYVDWRITAKTVVTNDALKSIMGIDDLIPEEIKKSEPSEGDMEFMNFLD
jgi:hypothetical protein